MTELLKQQLSLNLTPYDVVHLQQVQLFVHCTNFYQQTLLLDIINVRYYRCRDYDYQH